MASHGPRVFLTHGEDRAREALAAAIHQRFRIRAVLPGDRETVEL
jgi:predicted metal-dependent RNase